MKRTTEIWGVSICVGLAGGCLGVLGVEGLEYRTECAPGGRECMGNTARVCGEDGLWDEQICVNQTCVEGKCEGECVMGTAFCVEGTARRCGIKGEWLEQECVAQTCVSGTCMGECQQRMAFCEGNASVVCDSVGSWVNEGICAYGCGGGLCERSCAALAPDCAMGESCCASTDVPGGTYNRSNDSAFPATLSGFRLDKFEVTVGRFREFVDAYPASMPGAGAGVHPLIPGSGWDISWSAYLPATRAELIERLKCSVGSFTWTDIPGPNEYKPMNCISWYESFAFCAWDGGRLPTEAEWNYAAAGGDEQREYPWSDPPSSTIINEEYAVYLCGGTPQFTKCDMADVFAVGSKSSAGDGKWGHSDLSGSVWEWNLDWYAEYEWSCINCAKLSEGSARVLRGGGWNATAPMLLSALRGRLAPAYRLYNLGLRCAREPSP